MPPQPPQPQPLAADNIRAAGGCNFGFERFEHLTKQWVHVSLASSGYRLLLLTPSRTFMKLLLLLKMVAVAVALVIFCAAAEAAINPKHVNRVVQVCHLQSPPPATPADAVLTPFIPSMSLYTFEPPPYARPRDAALAAAAVGTCLEEPLSFAASVIGALKHAIFWRRFRRELQARDCSFPYALLYQAYSVQWILSWSSAAAFHFHEDFPYSVTEKLDYYGVFLSLVMSTYIAALRLWFGAAVQWRIKRRSVAASAVVAAAAASAFLYYMQFVKFDYGLHVAVCAVLMLLHCALYTTMWCRGAVAARYMVIGHICLFAAAPLEIGKDFPPFYKWIDGHGLWHLAAVPAAFMFHLFHLHDLKIYDELKKAASI